MPPFLTFYTSLGRIVTWFTPGVLRQRAKAGKEDVARMGERMARPSRERPQGPLVWLHGASVGEGLSLLPIIEGLRIRRPDVTLLMTSGTVAAAELMGQRLPEGVIHQYAPVDTPDFAARFTKYWAPELAIFAESELWPSLLESLRSRGARTALLSARMSEGSIRRWTAMSSSARHLLGGFDLVMAQDRRFAALFKTLGARDDGDLNLKLAAAPLPVDEAARAELVACLDGRPLLVAASTHPKEDEIVLDAFARLANRPDRPVLALVPRHPIRGDDLMEMVRERRLVVARRSLGEPVTPQIEVLLADTLGELGLWYAAARMSVVCGSLVNGVGGHNPLEPARLGCPFVVGPFTQGWQAVYRSLSAVDGYRTVSDAASLAYAFAKALDRPEDVLEMAERAQAEAGRGAAQLDRALDRLSALVDGR